MRTKKLTLHGLLVIVFASLLVAGLVACGGGGSSGDAPQQPPESDAGDTGSGGAGTSPAPIEVGENRFGAWIFYIDEAGLVHNDHASMATYLANLGVKRVFIKISDINYRWDSNQITFTGGEVQCGEWQDACEPANLQHYRDNGIEPWAWTYNDAHSYEAQADMLEAAVRVGYAGFVLDIEAEFDGATTTLESLLQAHRDRLDQLGTLVPDTFLLAATSWGNPRDHGMRIDIIDEFVDAHMPQTYIEKWGSSYIDDIAGTIQRGDCEYLDLGATKPIWHIVSHEDKLLSAENISDFFRHAGPHASLWRISNSTLAEEVERVDWAQTEFQPNACSSGNFAL